MALIDVSTGAERQFASKLAREAIDSDFEAFQTREQYRTLARMVPLFYGVAVLATTTLFAATRAKSSPFIAFVLAGLLLAVVLIRMLYWLRMRARADVQRLEVMRRDIRQARIVGPALMFGFSLVAAVFVRPDGIVEKSLLLVAIWTTAVATAFCLMRLVRTAVLIITGSTLPLVVTLLADGNDLTYWVAALLVSVSALICHVLIDNSQAFAEIVRSRFVIAGMHKSAEDARKAATAIANTDYLTGLPNWRFLQSLLASRIGAGEDGARPFAVGLLDLDGFKPINDI